MGTQLALFPERVLVEDDDGSTVSGEVVHRFDTGTLLVHFEGHCREEPIDIGNRTKSYGIRGCMLLVCPEDIVA